MKSLKKDYLVEQPASCEDISKVCGAQRDSKANLNGLKEGIIESVHFEDGNCFCDILYDLVKMNIKTSNIEFHSIVFASSSRSQRVLRKLN